jgi:hypothetical protein
MQAQERPRPSRCAERKAPLRDLCREIKRKREIKKVGKIYYILPTLRESVSHNNKKTNQASIDSRYLERSRVGRVEGQIEALCQQPARSLSLCLPAALSPSLSSQQPAPALAPART